MQPESFWPPKSGTVATSPIDLLKEQADLLANYDSALQGRVTTSYADTLDPTITVALYVINNNLRGYNYRLLSFETRGEDDITLRMHYRSDTVAAGTVSPHDTAGFKQLLKDALSNSHTRNILDWLVSLGSVMQDYRQDVG